MDLSGGSAGFVADSTTVTELPNKDGNVTLPAQLAPGVMIEVPSPPGVVEEVKVRRGRFRRG